MLMRDNKIAATAAALLLAAASLGPTAVQAQAYPTKPSA